MKLVTMITQCVSNGLRMGSPLTTAAAHTRDKYGTPAPPLFSIPSELPPTSHSPAWRHGGCWEGVWGRSHVDRTTSWYCLTYKGTKMTPKCSFLTTWIIDRKSTRLN